MARFSLLCLLFLFSTYGVKSLAPRRLTVSPDESSNPEAEPEFGPHKRSVDEWPEAESEAEPERRSVVSEDEDFARSEAEAEAESEPEKRSVSQENEEESSIAEAEPEKRNADGEKGVESEPESDVDSEKRSANVEGGEEFVFDAAVGLSPEPEENQLNPLNDEIVSDSDLWVSDEHDKWEGDLDDEKKWLLLSEAISSMRKIEEALSMVEDEVLESVKRTPSEVEGKREKRAATLVNSRLKSLSHWFQKVLSKVPLRRKRSLNDRASLLSWLLPSDTDEEEEEYPVRYYYQENAPSQTRYFTRVIRPSPSSFSSSTTGGDKTIGGCQSSVVVGESTQEGLFSQSDLPPQSYEVPSSGGGGQDFSQVVPPDIYEVPSPSISSSTHAPTTSFATPPPSPPPPVSDSPLILPQPSEEYQVPDFPLEEYEVPRPSTSYDEEEAAYIIP